MKHQTGILQQWIQLLSVKRSGQQAIERVRSEQHEQYETYRDQSHHAQHARDHFFGQVSAEHGDGSGPDRQYGHPQQQRTFVPAPDRGEAIVQGQLRVGMFRDIQHGKIIVKKKIRQHGERQHDEDQLPICQRPGNARQNLVIAGGAEYRQHAQGKRHKQRDN